MDPITPQPEQSQYQVTPETPHLHFLNKKFIVTFVILILLGTGAYAGIQYWQNQQVANEVVPTFTPRANGSTSLTTSWKTYTNTQYGFEFKYPADFVVKETDTTPDSKDFYCGGIDSACFKNFPKYFLSSAVALIGQKSSDNIILDINTIQAGVPVDEISKITLKFNDIDIFKTKFHSGNYPESSPGPTYISYNFFGGNPKHNFDGTNNSFNIILEGKDSSSLVPQESIVDQILSTFKFTNFADTSTWKTYTNTQYGFFIKYPNDWRVVEQGTQGIFVGFGPLSMQEDTLFDVLKVSKIPSLGIDPANPNHEITKIEDASISGLPAKRIYDRNMSVNQISTQLYITHGNTIIAVNQPTLNNSDYPFNHSYNIIIDQILSTFKFTE